MKSKLNSIAFGALVLGASNAALANPTVERDGMLASKEGKTLYTFTKDAANKSNCSGACATAWPPFMVANPSLAGGDFSIVVRDDGTSQWAFKGQPLYFFAADTRPGDKAGDGQGGVWFVAKPTAAKKAAKVSGNEDTYSTSSGSYTY